MHLSPAKYLIHSFGGVRKAATALNRTPSSVSKWQRLGNIPTELHITVLKQAKKQKLDITPNDLVFGRKVKPTK